MSDDERMERAKRIRRMREGERDDGGADDPSDDAGADPDATAGASGQDPETIGEEPGDEDPTEGEGDVADPTESAGDDPEPTPDQDSQPTDQDPAGGGDSPGEPTASGDARVELPDAEQMEAALQEASDEGLADVAASSEDPGGPAAGIAGEAVESTSEADTRVLEFLLGDEQYGLDIEYIEEIVRHDSITRVPNTPDFVEGVVDLRGQITTILNPKVTIGKADRSHSNLIVVFDSEAFDDQHIGWVVDDVRQVAPVHDEDVNDPPMDESYINGVIDREDDEDFVIWTTPDMALEEAD